VLKITCRMMELYVQKPFFFYRAFQQINNILQKTDDRSFMLNLKTEHRKTAVKS